MPSSLKIYYDGQCPLCTRYTRMLRLRDAADTVELHDLRESQAQCADLNSRGLDPDTGMAVWLDGSWYHGADAVHVLATLSTPSGAFNRAATLLLRKPWRARLVYPFLRFGRTLLLWGLGRTSINSVTEEERALPTLFAHAFGVFGFLHLLVYLSQFKGSAGVFASTWGVGVLGLCLAFRPASRRLFLGLALLMVVDALLHMPMGSNHTFLKNFFLMGFIASGSWAAFRGFPLEAAQAGFMPVGRFLLCTMYVFGVFHKINSDFLDPTVSCAVTLWAKMPWPLHLVDNLAFHQIAIWGTLLIETAILVCLLMPRTRRYAIVIGIGFHSLLALSAYAFYTAFSALTIALHLLFLSKRQAGLVLTSDAWVWAQRLVRSRGGATAMGLWLLALGVLAYLRSWSEFSLLWLPWVAWMCLCLWQAGRTESSTGAPAETSASTGLVARPAALNIVSALFFFSCFAPYLGLKTAQSMNMFANLRLEAGASNHLVFRSPPGPFTYLNDVVFPTDSSSSGLLRYVVKEGLGMTWYAMLDHLERNPDVRVSFERNGQMYFLTDAANLQAEIDEALHPRWVRWWLQFNLVDTRQPKPCALDR